jgi:NADPH:quinone reductase-like Zn-dependent oxidoreductase
MVQAFRLRLAQREAATCWSGPGSGEDAKTGRGRRGQTVLVLGAESGVGSAAIQIAKLFRARVITTAVDENKLEHAYALGG